MSTFIFQTKEQINEDTDVLEDVLSPCELVVYNDDVNTFDWVIESLMEVCRHSPEQAEQCSLLIHFKGQATVKHGTELELIPMKDELLNRGIDAAVESHEYK
ncbi:MAG: ATP-dependent Clp protease adaptor ClpS [Chitinophagaceae bacterium]|nr:MAG: ATP-dependent Clp protease adaptor ClpS [Chitinophagaceae bacterium]